MQDEWTYDELKYLFLDKFRECNYEKHYNEILFRSLNYSINLLKKILHDRGNDSDLNINEVFNIYFDDLKEKQRLNKEDLLEDIDRFNQVLSSMNLKEEDINKYFEKYAMGENVSDNDNNIC